MQKLNVTREFGRTLIVIPHSDDEVLLFGGLIRNVISAGVPIVVALVTNGDYEAVDICSGQIRPAETIRGLKVLGVDESQIVLMGYADTGMPEAESFLSGLYNEKNPEEIHRLRVGIHTYGLADHKDYHSMLYGIPALYTRNSLVGDIATLINSFQPHNIFTTHPLDNHGDHSALYKFIMQLDPQSQIYAGFAHCSLGDSAWPDEGSSFTCPPGLECYWDDAFRLELTSIEMEAKKAALLMHTTALKPDAVEFLNRFVKQDEIYFQMKRVEE